MRVKIFAFIWFAALAAAPITVSADDTFSDKPAACCEKPAADDNAATHSHDAMMACGENGGCDMPCCEDGASAAPASTDPEQLDAIEIFFAMDGQHIVPADVASSPVRQTATVFFHRPVWVGQTVLMGRHVIEHDTDRQARGEPCTHVYAADDMTTPVAVFHCTHLDAAAAGTAVVTLKSNTDGSQKLLQFQFKGEAAAHGYPTDR